MQKVGMAFRSLILSLVVFIAGAWATASATTFNGSFEGANPFEGWSGIFKGNTIDILDIVGADLDSKSSSTNTEDGHNLIATDGSTYAIFEVFFPSVGMKTNINGTGILSFDIAFISREYFSGSRPLDTVVQVTLGNTLLYENGTVALGVDENGIPRYDDWHTVTTPFANAIDVPLTIIVTNRSGFGIPPSVLFDNVRIAPVPIPASLPLLAAACGIVGLKRRFRK